MKDLANLDLMRSVAVILVAGSHLLVYSGHLPVAGWLGLTGVCYFFVHTCLVLMLSLERDPHVVRFYVRRIFRIYPLWLVILTLSLVTKLPMSPRLTPHFGYLAPTAKLIVSHVLLVFNLFGGPALIGASWTLPMEMQMYLFLPLLFLFARDLKNVWLLLLLSGYFMVYDYRTLPAVNSSLPMCVPYFLPGVMAFVLMKRKGLQRLPAWSFVVWLTALTAFAWRFGSFRNSWLICLALGLSLPLFKQVQWRPAVWGSHTVAKYSYGIYLTHIPAIWVSLYVFRETPVWLRGVVFVATVTGLSVFFYHTVELPCLKLGSRLARRIEPGAGPNRVAEALEPAP